MIGWPSTLEAKFPEARAFYIIILAALLSALGSGIYLIRSDQDDGVERPVSNRIRLGSRYGHHDGACHQFFGDGAILRPFVGFGLGWCMGGDSFNGISGYGTDPAVFNRKLILSCYTAMSALGQKQTYAVHKPMSAKCQKRQILFPWMIKFSIVATGLSVIIRQRKTQKKPAQEIKTE